MKQMMIAGNWKMNTTPVEAQKLTESIKQKINKQNKSLAVVLCPPFTSIETVSREISDTKIFLGAQNCYYKPGGAFTGEVSIPMLKSIGCTHCIVGHSERRSFFFETNDLVNLKLRALLEAGLTPILCIGESLEERKKGKTFDIIRMQLTTCLNDIEQKFFQNIVIAYEPVWAIGTGIAATPEQVQEAHLYIRSLLIDSFGSIAEKTLILYGGSVTDKNASEILSLRDVNGALVGGASLVADTFFSIINAGLKAMG